MPSFAALAQEPLSQPETFGEAKEKGIKAAKELPAKLKEIWRSKVAPLWQKMWNWAKEFWNSRLKARFENLWSEVKNAAEKEAEKRKPAIKEELEKEKQEMKQEASKTGRSAWERFKELLK